MWAPCIPLITILRLPWSTATIRRPLPRIRPSIGIPTGPKQPILRPPGNPDAGNGGSSIGIGKTDGILITEDGGRPLWKNGAGHPYLAETELLTEIAVSRTVGALISAVLENGAEDVRMISALRPISGKQ